MSEFENLCQCYLERQHNQKYKHQSLGYRGEALHSLSKCSELKIITRHVKESTGYEAYFKDGAVVRLNFIDKDRPGTIVQVRQIHANNFAAQKCYLRNRELQYQHCLSIMNDFSMILYDVTLILSNEFVNNKKNSR